MHDRARCRPSPAWPSTTTKVCCRCCPLCSVLHGNVRAGEMQGFLEPLTKNMTTAWGSHKTWLQPDLTPALQCFVSQESVASAGQHCVSLSALLPVQD